MRQAVRSVPQAHLALKLDPAGVEPRLTGEDRLGLPRGHEAIDAFGLQDFYYLRIAATTRAALRLAPQPGMHSDQRGPRNQLGVADDDTEPDASPQGVPDEVYLPTGKLAPNHRTQPFNLFFEVMCPLVVGQITVSREVGS